MINLTVNCDGGSRGNPGPAGIGIIIQNAKPASPAGRCKVAEISKFIGIATNNQAEYQAVIEALKYLDGNFINQDIQAEFFLDSELVVEQLNQRYKVKNEGLKSLFWEIRKLMMKLGGKITFAHIRREQNKIADRLVNSALDQAMKGK